MPKVTVDDQEMEYELLVIDGQESSPNAYRFVMPDRTLVVTPRGLLRFSGLPTVFRSSSGSHGRKTWSCMREGDSLHSFFVLYFRPHTVEEQNALAFAEHRETGDRKATDTKSERDWPDKIRRKDIHKYLHVSPATVTNWIKRGVLRVHKIGSVVICLKREVDEDVARFGKQEQRKPKK